MNENTIIYGDALSVLKTMPAESVNCCISSPPYWGLRDYGVEGQLGLEPTFEEYIDKLCAIYDEVRRILRKDGTCWVNLGDTYGGSTGEPNAPKLNRAQVEEHKSASRVKKYLPAKSLCLIPQRFAIEMVNRGWILRNIVVWHKPNPMPSSAKDRFTVDFEYVYFFVKSKKYFFEPIYEPKLDPADDIRRITKAAQYKTNTDDGVAKVDNWKLNLERAALGRNKRTVWTIPTQAFPEAHFATYPEKLVEPMILAGCPKEVCKKCGQGRRKVYEKSGGTIGKSWHDHNDDIGSGIRQTSSGVPLATAKSRAEKENPYKIDFIGYTDCGCNAGYKNGIVLDPFGGSMTTGLVAYKNKRNYIMVELKQEYVEMGKKRLLAEKEKYGLLENT